MRRVYQLQIKILCKSENDLIFMYVHFSNRLQNFILKLKCIYKCRKTMMGILKLRDNNITQKICLCSGYKNSLN
jgi:hypothetical protein